MRYYIKRLGSQELGSVGADGRPSRGRYVYVSKDEEVTSLFPPLSSVITNDGALLPIVPLYQENCNKIYCNYIYHNDKLTLQNGTRNEYRIYSNRALEQNQWLFQVDDILVFRKGNIGTGEESEEVYFLDLLQDHTSEYYLQCNSLAENSSIRGAHAIYDGTFPVMEEKIERISTNGNVGVVIDEAVATRAENTANETNDMANLFNANTFRDFVMVGYQNLCAITRTVIRYDTYMNLEAAHIKPRSHGGLYLPNNGMALCRDLHWAFDKGFFTLNDSLEVVVHPQTTSDYLRSFDGRQIYIPNNDFFVPNLGNVEYHRNNVYGLFLTTGRL